MSLPAGAPVRVEITQLRPQDVASARETVRRDDMTVELGRMFQDVMAVLGRQRVTPSGPRFARYHSFGELIDLEAGVPVASPIRPEGGVSASTLPGGPAARTVHIGSYEELPGVYEAVGAWIERTNRRSAGAPWESYVNDPLSEPDPDRWRTDILWPLAVR